MIMAMNMGADDFIAKPFDQSLLMAKRQAMLRRTYDLTNQKLLARFSLRNTTLMILILVISVLVFGIFYGIIYRVTSNAYYFTERFCFIETKFPIKQKVFHITLAKLC